MNNQHYLNLNVRVAIERNEDGVIDHIVVNYGPEGQPLKEKCRFEINKIRTIDFTLPLKFEWAVDEY